MAAPGARGANQSGYLLGAFILYQGTGQKNTSWTSMVRSSLRRLEDADGAYLEAFLQQQSQEPTVFALSEMEQRKLRLSLVNATDRQIMVSIPEDEHTNPARGKKEQYESIQIQAKLAEIDEKMHFKIWIPNSDKQRVLQNWHP